MWHRIIVFCLKKLGRASCKGELEMKTGNQSCFSHEPKALLHGTAERVGKSPWCAERSLVQGQLSQRRVALLRPGGLRKDLTEEGKALLPTSLGLKCLESSLHMFDVPACPRNRGRGEGADAVCPCLSVYMTARENRALSLSSWLPRFTSRFLMNARGRHLLQKRKKCWLFPNWLSRIYFIKYSRWHVINRTTAGLQPNDSCIREGDKEIRDSVCHFRGRIWIIIKSGMGLLRRLP